MTTVRGTQYELACLQTLERWLRMQVYRTGGANDRGMDLCGWWAPHALQARRDTEAAPLSAADRMRVIVQCKAEAKPAGPSIVRELEGTLVRAVWDKFQPSEMHTSAAPLSAHEAPLVGVLATLSGFSKQAMIQARSSRLPLLLLHLTSPRADFADLQCAGFVWNAALAASQGPLQGRFDVAWIEQRTRPRGKLENRVALYRDGVQVA